MTEPPPSPSPQASSISPPAWRVRSLARSTTNSLSVSHPLLSLSLPCVVTLSSARVLARSRALVRTLARPLSVLAPLPVLSLSLRLHPQLPSRFVLLLTSYYHHTVARARCRSGGVVVVVVDAVAVVLHRRCSLSVSFIRSFILTPSLALYPSATHSSSHSLPTDTTRPLLCVVHRPRSPHKLVSDRRLLQQPPSLPLSPYINMQPSVS